jgi:hypothetical protein
MGSDNFFNLPEFIAEYFPSFEFGGGVFHRWPIGLRFEIGMDQVARTKTLYDFTFSTAEECILVSQDWSSGNDLAERYTPLFATPGVFSSVPSSLQTVESAASEGEQYSLTWALLRPHAFNVELMFQAIANGDHMLTPSISGRVYAIDPRAKVIMHMYDDRGLDVIASDSTTLLPLYETFNEWVLERKRV